MAADADVLIVGAGPAGASAAIRLAKAGWQVTLIEQQRYPRHKVCGECITAGSWALLDELDVGAELRQLAGPELRHVGWISTDRTLSARMPACPEGSYPYGRALGRNHLDSVLLERARSLGVTILQPAKLLDLSGEVGHFECRYAFRSPRIHGTSRPRTENALRAPVVIDAHGSWERELPCSRPEGAPASRVTRSDSELLAFKSSFQNARLRSGYLPVISFSGGYGGMVIADHGRATLACCIRRDALEKCRVDALGETAGAAIEAHLRRSCPGIADALKDARRDGSWLSVGPIRPGIRVESTDTILRIGNAAGEVHPLIGEGISMALQSAALLVAQLGRKTSATPDWKHLQRVRRTYAQVWRRELALRLGISQLYAHVAMNPTLAPAAQRLFTRLPTMLTFAARVAGKARPIPSQRFNSGAA